MLDSGVTAMTKVPFTFARVFPRTETASRSCAMLVYVHQSRIQNRTFPITERCEGILVLLMRPYLSIQKIYPFTRRTLR